MNLSTYKDTYLTIAAAVGAGVDGAIVESAAIDCQSYDRVMFELMLGTVTNAAVINVYVEECATSGGVYAKIAASDTTLTVGAGGGAAASNKMIQVDCKITQRYIKIVYQRTVANSAFLAGLTSLYDGKRIPSDLPTVVLVRTTA
jgi:hypothetical protein